MSQIQEWYYKYDADITFGEVHVSKAPKIILASTLIGLAVLGTSALIFKDYIRDFVNNPQLEFDSSIVKYDEQSGIYSTDVEISNAQFFDPNKYIYTKLDSNGEKDFSSLTYEYNIDSSNLDLTTVGDYTIIYNSHNKIQSAQNTLVVHLKDTTAPIVNLNLDDDKKYHVDLDATGAYTLELIRGKETKNFDPSKYIESVSDNYSDSENVKIEYTKNIDFNSNRTDVIYSATDEAGNLGVTNLRLTIVEDIDAIKAAQEEELKKAEEEKLKLEKEKEKLEEENKKMEEEKKKQEAATTTNNNSNDNNNSTDNNTNQQQTPQNPSPEPEPEPNPEPVDPPAPPPVYEEEPSISATDVTVSISDGEDAIVQQIISGVNYRGNTGVAQPTNMPGFDVPLEVGTYIVTWTTTNGLSCTQTITITE